MEESDQAAEAMRSKSYASGKRAKRRILIVDAQPLLRRGLASLIEHEPDLMVCAEAATQQGGMAALVASKPDLVITDYSFTDGQSLDMVKEIRVGHARLPVLVLSRHEAPSYADRAFQAGASGYVTKREVGETVLSAIRRVLNGQQYVSPKIRGTGCWKKDRKVSVQRTAGSNDS